jgi:hypothetical protein
VDMTPVCRQLEAPDAKPEEPAVPSAPALPVRPEGLIEILLPSGVTLRVDARVDGPALRRVVEAVTDR